MGETKPTPGPWHATPSPKGGHNIYDAENNVPAIARTYRIADDETVEANAHLIASAPDLLLALRCAERLLDDFVLFAGTPGAPLGIADLAIGRDDLRAAIAKAQGDT
jgi:hypothetical protein